MPLPFDPQSLNADQLEAVNHSGGPLLIFAGAGSGKTRVITARIARLMGEGIPSSRILAVTFTNKAAKEMRERITGMVGEESAKGLWMGTFHALCARLLRIDGLKIGLDPQFVVYDDGDQLGLMREIIKSQNIDEKSIQPRAVLSEISRAKEKLLSPEQYRDQATGFFERIVASLYPKYNELLTKASALDFDDLLLFAVRLLEQREDVRLKYQERFLHLLVDEYQDVNFSQYKFVQMMGGLHRNIAIVGDDDQSIYAWRGADVSLILRFGSDYPDARIIKLTQNYRSTQTILDGAYEVIRRNRSRSDKRLWTANGKGQPITLTETGTEGDEAMLVAHTIIQDVGRGARRFGDFAVLYRTNAQSRALEEVFVQRRIPHILIGGPRFYERKEIKDMVAYLRLVLNPRDDVSFRRSFNTPTRGLGDAVLGKLSETAEHRGLSLYEAALDQELVASLPKKQATSLKSYTGGIEDARVIAETGPVTPVLRLLLTRSGYLEELKLDHTEEGQARLENLQEFVNVTTQYDFGSETPSLSEFLEGVALMADVDGLKDSADAVTLMTLHSAKGLEYPVVFMTGMEEGVFPHSRSMNSDTQLEEERRLCYVGMTRAREQLHMLYAQRRSLYGQPNFANRSRFLNDIPGELVDSLIESAPRPEIRRVETNRTRGYGLVEPVSERPLRGPEWRSPFDIGQQVRHAKFGTGVVVACNPLRGDVEVTVAFPGDAGVKKLVQSLAKLEKVGQA